jgi:hypothetical protein
MTTTTRGQKKKERAHSKEKERKQQNTLRCNQNGPIFKLRVIFFLLGFICLLSSWASNPTSFLGLLLFALQGAKRA